jgi:probable F420-dependent oxidoreductase
MGECRRLSVDVPLTGPLAEASDRARTLFAIGVDGVYTSEEAHDPFLPLARAGEVAGLGLTTNIAVALPRSPLHLAHAAWDLQALSGGRFRLGLGSQVRPHIERRYGSTWSRPVERMREWIEALGAIFACWQQNQPLDFEGEFTNHTLMTPAHRPAPLETGRPPVLVGAFGPRMIEMAAEVADGILLLPFNSQRHLSDRTRPAINRGLATGGRDIDDLELVDQVIVAPGRNDEELASAADALRSILAFFASTPAYRSVLEVEGWDDVHVELHAMTRGGRWHDMPALISAEMLSTLAVTGSPRECAETISARAIPGASRVCLNLAGPIDDDCVAELVAELSKLSGTH